ncbi:MAG: hypothetical protein HY784_03605 [Chloroflexi bacterium]|nr:hypothetical protein [Chloroflexota bacterium]
MDADKERVSSISGASTLEEIAEFWDAHSLADYDDQSYEVQMRFLPSARRNYVSIDPDLLEELQGLAGQRRVATQTLVNLWLRQRVDEIKSQKVPA